MQVIEITPSNLDQHLTALISLHDEFLCLLAEGEDRSAEQKREILELMAGNEATGLLLVTEQNAPVGISYFNLGTGYSCGGYYLWLNGIYIRSEYQQQGFGTRLVQHIESLGRAKGITLFITSRHLENEASKGLFARSAFEQNEMMIMTKEYGRT